MTRIRRLRAWVEPRLPYLNFLLLAAAWTGNYFIQEFCQPVEWAAVALALAFGAFLAWPWLEGAAKGWRYLAIFLQGLAFSICCYCMQFMGWGSLILGLLLGFLLLPLLVWVPVLCGLQIVWRIRQTELRGAALVGLLGAVSLLPAQVWFYRQYQAVEQIARELYQQKQLTTDNLARRLPRTYVTERIVGMHFRYHTRMEDFDGWRPPLHDPLLDVCYWLHHYRDPLAIGNADFDRVALYRRLFPGRLVKPDCVCAHSQDGLRYRDWQPEAGKTGWHQF